MGNLLNIQKNTLNNSITNQILKNEVIRPNEN